MPSWNTRVFLSNSISKLITPSCFFLAISNKRNNYPNVNSSRQAEKSLTTTCKQSCSQISLQRKWKNPLFPFIRAVILHLSKTRLFTDTKQKRKLDYCAPVLVWMDCVLAQWLWAPTGFPWQKSGPFISRHFHRTNAQPHSHTHKTRPIQERPDITLVYMYYSITFSPSLREHPLAHTHIHTNDNAESRGGARATERERKRHTGARRSAKTRPFPNEHIHSNWNSREGERAKRWRYTCTHGRT